MCTMLTAKRRTSEKATCTCTCTCARCSPRRGEPPRRPHAHARAHVHDAHREEENLREGLVLSLPARRWHVLQDGGRDDASPLPKHEQPVGRHRDGPLCAVALDSTVGGPRHELRQQSRAAREPPAEELKCPLADSRVEACGGVVLGGERSHHDVIDHQEVGSRRAWRLRGRAGCA